MLTKVRPAYKTITDEIETQMVEILNSRSIEGWDKSKFGFYFIDVSGKYGVFYTLWRFKPSTSQHVNPLTYITNLSIDPIEAATKARRIAGACPIELDADGNNVGLQGKREVFTFGKYRGQCMGDVFADNPSYFTFLNKLIQKQDLKLSPANTALVQKYTELYFETLTKQNQETSTCAYFGAVGEVMTKPVLTVTHVNTQPGYIAIKLEDALGNKYLTYNLPEGTEKGAVIEPDTCKILDHKEVVGIKYTKLGYFKFPRKNAKKAAQ